MITVATQTQTEILPYTAKIEASNPDTVASATWSIAPAGPTIGMPANSGAMSTVSLSGVRVNTEYTLSCHLVGASGYSYDGFILVSGVLHH